MDISVVIPVYGCRAALPELHRRLVESLSQISSSFEIILVDDHCPQNSWEVIEQICRQDPRVVGLRMSRNFGQIRAITAGLDHSRGEWVVVMDCDLQDRPESILELYSKAMEGYDVVFARREGRKDTGITKFFSRMFYKVYDYFTDGVFDSSICNFSISNRKVIDAYCSMREQNRAYTLFLRWLGFNQTAIDLQADARFEGKSSYTFRKKLRLAEEIITSQSNKPLMIAVRTGFIISILAFFYLIYLIIRNAVAKDFSAGWPSIIGSIYLMGGLILTSVGIVGIYVGNTFNESKHRPLYVISEYRNFQAPDPQPSQSASTVEAPASQPQTAAAQKRKRR
jgi:dolichol-phosphate mannosyltransferase